MSEQVVTAEPTTEVAGGEAVSEAPATVAAETTAAPEAAPAKEPERALTLDEILEQVWDKNNLPPKAPQPKAEASTDQAPKVEPEPAQSSPAIAPPNSWSAESQAKWASLPPDLQKYVADRESQAHQQISRQGAELQTYEPLREVFGWLNQMGVQRGQEHQIVRQWANAQHLLDSKPEEGLLRLAQSYNVTPDRLVQLLGGQMPKQPDQQQPSAVDDLFRDTEARQHVANLQKEIATLKQQLGQVHGTVSAREQAELQRQQQAEARQRQEIEEAVQKFSVGKKYMDEISDDFAHEIRFVKSKNPGLSNAEVMEKAYTRAINANDSVRERVAAEQRKAEAEKAAKEAAAKAAQAKKLSSMNVRTGASATSPAFDGKWDDSEALSAMYDRIQSRA